MKETMLVFVMLAIVILSGCNVFEENKSLKAKNQELEQRVKELDQRVNELEQVISKRDQDEFALTVCLGVAKERRENAFKLNDREHKKGSYNMPIQVMQYIQNVYKDDCEECYRKYGKR
jgi:outer membrane murein-binding lipoprotein Lpp